MPFVHDGIRGVADFLERVTDGHGGTSYEPVDAKLARGAAKPGHVLQLCFYAEAVAARSGRAAERVHIELGSGARETIRVDDVAAVLAPAAIPACRDRRRASDRGNRAGAVRPLRVLRVRAGLRSRVARCGLPDLRRRDPPVGPRPARRRRGGHDRGSWRAGPRGGRAGSAAQGSPARQAHLQVLAREAPTRIRRRSSSLGLTRGQTSRPPDGVSTPSLTGLRRAARARRGRRVPRLRGPPVLEGRRRAVLPVRADRA